MGEILKEENLKKSLHHHNNFVFAVIIILIMLVFPSNCIKGEVGIDFYVTSRRQMVQEQIQLRGISDHATLEAMRNVKRHLFVPSHKRFLAYQDTPLTIGHGQTISQPYIVAYMTEKLNLKPGDKVLEIGTGSGYQAAVLRELDTKVYTVEIIKALGEKAISRLKLLEYDDVKVKIANGYYGWKEHAPFDAIIVTAAAQFIPPPLLEQLGEEGRMIIPVGSPFRVQHLILITKEEGEVKSKRLIPVRFVPFTKVDN